LRDPERLAVVGPPEWLGLAVVGLDELDDAVGQLVDGVELGMADQVDAP